MAFFLATWWNMFADWWEGTTIGQEVDAAGKAAIQELEQVTPADLESAVETTAGAMLPVLTGGGSVGDIIAAGVTAAEAAFKSAGTQLSATTLSTFVSTLHNSVVTQQTTAQAVPPTVVAAPTSPETPTNG